MRVSILFILLICTNIVLSQNEKEEVMKPIQLLFEGMKKADTTMVRKAFSVEAKMFTSSKDKEGNETIREDLLNNFLNTIGGKTKNTPDWNEKLMNTEVKIDGGIAQVWTEYSFFVGEKFSHCGVNAFQLMKENSEWKIIHIMDTRRREGCNENFSD